MDSIKFLLAVLILILSMQSLALYVPAGGQVNMDKAVVTNIWVAGFYNVER
jgi:hypothetical protein